VVDYQIEGRKPLLWDEPMTGEEHGKSGSRAARNILGPWQEVSVSIMVQSTSESGEPWRWWLCAS
jgi:hypothetical protein